MKLKAIFHFFALGTLFLKFLLICLLLFSRTAVDAQDFKTDTCQLKGKVDTVFYTIQSKEVDGLQFEKILPTEIVYVYNPQGFLIYEDHSALIVADGDHYKSYIRSYNESGTNCLIEYELSHGDTVHAKCFSYSGNNIGVYPDCIFDNPGADTLYYEYNRKGLLIKGYENGISRKPLWHKYNDNGFLIQTMDFDSTMFYEGYDPTNEAQAKRMDQKYKSRSTIIKYAYNAIGQLTRITFSSLGGKPRGSMNMLYNENGDLASEEVNVTERMVIKRTYSYVYDQNKNWIEKRTFLQGQEIYFETQKISYY